MNLSRKDQPYTSKLKGVAALLGEPTVSAAHFTDINLISLSKQQPRRYFDPEKLEQLILSVKEHGILEPLLVRPLLNSEYELVAGERRYRAAQAAKLNQVPVVIKVLSDGEALHLALVENLQREDLNPVEETEGILQLLALHLEVAVEDVVALLHRMRNEVKGNVNQNVLVSSEGEKIQAFFNTFGLISWESFVSSRLPLLSLPTEILEVLRQGRIAYTKAQAIARLKDEEKRKTLLDEAISQALSLSNIQERIKAVQSLKNPPTTLKFRASEVIRRHSKSKAWDDPKKQKRLEKLLIQMEALLTDGYPEDS